MLLRHDVSARQRRKAPKAEANIPWEQRKRYQNRCFDSGTARRCLTDVPLDPQPQRMGASHYSYLRTHLERLVHSVYVSSARNDLIGVSAQERSAPANECATDTKPGPCYLAPGSSSPRGRPPSLRPSSLVPRYRHMFVRLQYG